MSRAGGPGEIEKLISTITLLLDRHEGESMLVHTVSYGLMKEVVAGLRRKGVQGVISYETSGDRELALRRFKDERGVLVAPSMDRGVDLPDDLCRVVVVAKMPFAYLGDRQVSERMRLPGGQTWYDIATTRTLVQMTGRGVRHENDWCVTYILDKQFQRYWGKQGRRLLPGWWRDSIKGDT
jgi:ATP-dependent DNA helicase DinG